MMMRHYIQSAKSSIMLLIALSAIFISSCAQDETLSPTPPPPNGANEQALPNQTAVGALRLLGNDSMRCSVAFISAQYALTAARCITQTNPSLYTIHLDSPVDQMAAGLTISAISIHPLWNSSEIGQSRAHLQSLRMNQPGYYAGAASYDLAVLQLTTPKLDGTFLDPLRGSSLFESVETLYYTDSEVGVSRSGGRLRVTERTPTTLASIEYSLIASTTGGGSAVITLDSGRTALIGLASGGDGQGTVFTLVGIHSTFISDILNGLYSPNADPNRYRIEVSGPTMVEPEITDDPNGFDCTTMSDGFCDRNCRRGDGDIDCEMMVEEPEGSSFGAPCSSGSDCLSRLCLGINQVRFVCSDFCNPNAPTPCPRGFSCIGDNEGDYVCGPTPETINNSTGEPTELKLFGADCRNDAECTTSACISYQGQRWCSERCMNDDQCPISYICGAVSGGRACVPPQ